MSDLVVCSLLAQPENYQPDTHQNLHTDEEAKQYWLDCFKDLIGKLAKQARKSQPDDETAEERADTFQRRYIDEITQMQSQTDEPLTIRRYLDLHESLLRLCGFSDPWKEQKSVENEFAITRLRARLDELDAITEESKRWVEICRGLLAGNMFDWGAQIVSDILEKNASFGLYEALNSIQKRPWVIDDLDRWLERIKGPPHKCAAIFVDNSGVDVTLGVLPFARELLKRGTKVILCANSEPALNDVTKDELDEIVRRACTQCPVLDEAWQSQRLLVFGNGQTSVCLDLRKLPKELNDALAQHETDLILLEGMGRALHTNLNAKFTCETLKLVVVKNQFLANRLGGDTFSVICKYES